LEAEFLLSQLGRLGGTGFWLAHLGVELEGSVMIPVSEINRMRRAMVDALAGKAPVAKAVTTRVIPWEALLPAPAAKPADVSEQLNLLCRNDAQIDAARVSTNPAEQLRLWAEAQNLLVRAVCGVPVMENLRGIAPAATPAKGIVSTAGRNYDPSFDWDGLRAVRDAWPRRVPVPNIAARATRRPHRCFHDDPSHQAIVARHLSEAPVSPNRALLEREARGAAVEGFGLRLRRAGRSEEREDHGANSRVTSGAGHRGDAEQQAIHRENLPRRGDPRRRRRWVPR
jgi:hypothetical protein